MHLTTLVPLVVSLADPAKHGGATSNLAHPPLPPPLSRQTENVCARPPEQLEFDLAVEAQRTTAMWQQAPQGVPWFVTSPACAWRCDGRSARGPSCTDNLEGFLRYTCRDSSFALGLNAPDSQYHDDLHARFRGRMFQVPASLVRASLDYPQVVPFKKELTRLGYQFVEFTSTSVPNPPSGFGRVLVLIEGDDFDQWYQLAIDETAPRTLGRNVDMSVVQKRDESGRALSPPQFFMNGYSHFMTPEPKWENEGLGSHKPLNRCIMCHPSGLRGIYPKPGSVAPEEEPVMRHVQKKLDATMALGFGGYYDNARLGPAMGPVDPPSRAALLARCAPGLSADATKRVSHAMSCASCHDGQYRAILNAGTDYSTIAHKIVGATPDGIMPPGEPLSASERAFVSSCLRLEYAELLRQWLGEARCEKPAEPERDRDACLRR